MTREIKHLFESKKPRPRQGNNNQNNGRVDRAKTKIYQNTPKHGGGGGGGGSF